MTIEKDSETEILILSNILVVFGGIAAAFGWTSLSYGGLAMLIVGLVLFGIGIYTLIMAFRNYQLDNLKVTWAALQAQVKERIDE